MCMQCLCGVVGAGHASRRDAPLAIGDPQNLIIPIIPIMPRAAPISIILIIVGTRGTQSSRNMGTCSFL